MRYQIRHALVQYGADTIIEDVNFEIKAGEKVAIVSKKPQTTRTRITGIHTVGDEQFVFLDTPGVHKPRTKLGDFMVKAANDSMHDADAVVLVVDPGKEITTVEENIMDYFRDIDHIIILYI